MTDKPDTEDKNPDERSDDDGGIIGRKVLAVIVGFVFILACIYSLGACDSANKKSSSSYSNSLSRSYASSRYSGGNYSKGSSSGFSTKETTQAYGTLTNPPTDSSESKKKQKTTTESSAKETPEFDVEDFVHPEDFYDWYKDDFVEYEEAEDYWEEWQ